MRVFKGIQMDATLAIGLFPVQGRFQSDAMGKSLFVDQTGERFLVERYEEEDLSRILFIHYLVGRIPPYNLHIVYRWLDGLVEGYGLVEWEKEGTRVLSFGKDPRDLERMEEKEYRVEHLYMGTIYDQMMDWGFILTGKHEDHHLFQNLKFYIHRLTLRRESLVPEFLQRARKYSSSPDHLRDIYYGILEEFISLSK